MKEEDAIDTISTLLFWMTITIAQAIMVPLVIIPSAFVVWVMLWIIEVPIISDLSFWQIWAAAVATKLVFQTYAPIRQKSH